MDLDDSLVDKSFLYYWFDWDAGQIKKEQGAGTTMVHVSMKSMNARKISLPSLPEQERIVGILDEASEAIEELKASLTAKLAYLQELKQSILQKAFTGELTVSAEPMLQEARL